MNQNTLKQHIDFSKNVVKNIKNVSKMKLKHIFG